MSTLYLLRRSSYGCESDPWDTNDCLFAFPSESDALEGAKASAQLTLDRYFRHADYAKAEKVEKGYNATLETLGYSFCPYEVTITREFDDLNTINGVPMLYAIVQNHRVASVHCSQKEARTALKNLLKVICKRSPRQLCPHGDSYDGDLLEVQEAMIEYNAGIERYEIETKLNDDRSVYVDNYGDEWDEEYWSSEVVSTVEMARVPVGTWSEQDIETQAFAGHWTEFIGGAFSLESIVSMVFGNRST